MYIIGMIFKIIGILLLCLLGIVLALILSVLFVPIRYRFHWEKHPESSHSVSVKLSWLLHILAFSVEYQENAHYVIRVFGIPIKKGSLQQEDEAEEQEEAWEDVSDDFSEVEKQKSSKKEKKTVKPVEEKRSSGNIENVAEIEIFLQKEKQQNREENVPIDVQKEIDLTKENRTSEKENTKKENVTQAEIETDAQEFDIAVPDPSKKKMHIWEKWMAKWNEFVAFLKKIPKFFKSMFYKARDLWQNVDNKREHVLDQLHIVIDFWRAEETQAGKRLLFGKGKKIGKHILPKKWKGYIRFGLSDPADTGKALGVIAVVGGLVGVLPDIEPDFSQETLEATVDCRGRFQIGYLLWQGLTLWFHEDMQRLKNNFEKVRRAL